MEQDDWTTQKRILYRLEKIHDTLLLIFFALGLILGVIIGS